MVTSSHQSMGAHISFGPTCAGNQRNALTLKALLKECLSPTNVQYPTKVCALKLLFSKCAEANVTYFLIMS